MIETVQVRSGGHSEPNLKVAEDIKGSLSRQPPCPKRLNQNSKRSHKSLRISSYHTDDDI